MTNASFGYILTRGHGKLHLPQPRTNFLNINLLLKRHRPRNTLPSSLHNFFNHGTFESLSVVAGIATNKARKNIQQHQLWDAYQCSLWNLDACLNHIWQQVRLDNRTTNVFRIQTFMINIHCL